MTRSSDSSEIVIYSTVDGRIKIDTILHDETIWLTQTKIADLFGVKRPAITKHLKNIFESGELNEEVVSSDLEHTTQHGAIDGKTQTRTGAEALVADTDDLKQLEDLEKRLLDNGGKQNGE